MTLICECGSPAIEITDASETHDEHDAVVSFWEKYQCDCCDRTGKFYLNADNNERLTGCLTYSGGVF
jgi:hypothetical protein